MVFPDSDEWLSLLGPASRFELALFSLLLKCHTLGSEVRCGYRNVDMGAAAATGGLPGQTVGGAVCSRNPFPWPLLH